MIQHKTLKKFCFMNLTDTSIRDYTFTELTFGIVSASFIQLEIRQIHPALLSGLYSIQIGLILLECTETCNYL